MFDMSGHSLTVRGAKAGDEVPPGAAIVVEAEDMGSAIILVFDQEGNAIQHDDSVSEIAMVYYADAARFITKATQIEVEGIEHTSET